MVITQAKNNRVTTERIEHSTGNIYAVEIGLQEGTIRIKFSALEYLERPFPLKQTD